jgi:photosystem II stability/assembly factor-like uncharacterized protein
MKNHHKEYVVVFIIILFSKLDMNCGWVKTDSIRVQIINENNEEKTITYFYNKGLTTKNNKEIYYFASVPNYSSAIFKSSDSGKTFHLNYPANLKYEKIFDIITFTQPTDKFIIAAGDSGSIVRTFDAGKSWKKEKFKPLNWAKINQVIFRNENEGFLLFPYNNKYQIYFTSNSGDDWEVFTKLPNFYYENNYLEICYLKNDEIIIAENMITKQGDTYFHKSNDFGKTWETYLGADISTKGSIYFLDYQTGFNYGLYEKEKNSYFRYIKRSSNSGKSWQFVFEISEVSYNVNFEMKFYGKDFGHYSAFGETYTTYDGGLNWYIDSNLNKLWFDNYVIYNKFLILNLNPLRIVAISNFHETSTDVWNYVEDPNSVEFYSSSSFIFPNPAQDVLNLTNIPDGAIDFEIINQYGVQQLKGFVSKQIDVSQLPAGIYFLKLNNQTTPSKFIKL